MLSATARTYRNAYTGLSKETWLLSFIMLVNRSGTMVVPFMTLYLTTQMGYSISQAGIVFGLFGAGAFSGAWLGGKMTDKIGFYPVQLMTLVGGGILFIVLGQMKDYTLICIFTYAVSFINEAFRPANSTAIAFYSKPENRTRSYALNRLAINIGWALGSFAGGVIIKKISYEALFWVDGITNISAALIMWFFLRPVDYKPQHHDKTGQTKTRSPLRDTTYLWFIAATMLFAACFFQVFTNIPVYFKKELHISELYIGLLMAINGVIIALVEMVLVYKMENKGRNHFLIPFGVALVGVSFLLLNIPFIGAAGALVMIIIVTFGEIFSMPFMNTYWIGRTEASNRGQYAGLYTMAWSAAQCLGPLLGAQVADHSGFTVLWWIVGIMAVGAAIAFYQILKSR